MPPSDQESCRKRRQATSAVLATAPLVASTRPKSPAADPRRRHPHQRPPRWAPAPASSRRSPPRSLAARRVVLVDLDHACLILVAIGSGDRFHENRIWDVAAISSAHVPFGRPDCRRRQGRWALDVLRHLDCPRLGRW